MSRNTAKNLGTVSIIGPGLIGGSIGLGLKKNRLAKSVIGIGHRRVSLAKALKMGAIDRATQNIAKGVRDADIVILCTSVRLIPEMAARAIPSMKRGAVLTDVGSTKGEIVALIEEMKREGIAFIGGHPVAGSEQRGVAAARGDLFKGSVCILTPTDCKVQELREVKSLWRGLGARVRVMSPEEHDRTLAVTSHLPLLLAASLVKTVGKGKLPYCGAGLCDMTRIASSDPALWCDILLQNRREVLSALAVFQKELDSLKSTIDGRWSRILSSRLMRAKRLRDTIVNGSNKS